MNPLLKRISSDLKADSRKTLLMIVLAACFAYLWGSFLLEGDPHSVPLLEASVEAPPPLGADSGPISGEAVSFCPEFLKQPLPFEAIGVDPFRAFSLLPEKIPERRAGVLAEGTEGARRPEQDPRKGLQLACTLTGRGEPYAVLNGKIIRAGDRIQEFTVEEIGDGYVVLKGQAGEVRLEVAF